MKNKNLEIVIDIDDTLWGLNKRICEKRGIKENLLRHFSVYDNSLLTREEKDMMIHDYKDVNIFKNIDWYDGVEKLLELEKFGASILINSNNFSEEIANQKLLELKKVLPDIKDTQIQMNIISDCKKKKIQEPVFILMDDSPHNIANTDAEHYILLEKPWNISRYGFQTLEKITNVHPERLYFVPNFKEGYNLMECLIKDKLKITEKEDISDELTFSPYM